jgi:hypothetical protein
VTDGTRTRALRSHNAKTWVATRCRELQNPLIYAESFADGYQVFLRVALRVVSKVVSNGAANHCGNPPCRTEYLLGRADPVHPVQDLVRAVQLTPASQREKRILLHLSTGGPHMTICVRNAMHPRLRFAVTAGREPEVEVALV